MVRYYLVTAVVAACLVQFAASTTTKPSAGATTTKPSADATSKPQADTSPKPTDIPSTTKAGKNPLNALLKPFFNLLPEEFIKAEILIGGAGGLLVISIIILVICVVLCRAKTKVVKEKDLADDAQHSADGEDSLAPTSKQLETSTPLSNKTPGSKKSTHTELDMSSPLSNTSDT